jgi:hypothetical protein
MPRVYAARRGDGAHRRSVALDAPFALVLALAASNAVWSTLTAITGHARAHEAADGLVRARLAERV